MGTPSPLAAGGSWPKLRSNARTTLARSRSAQLSGTFTRRGIITRLKLDEIGTPHKQLGPPQRGSEPDATLQLAPAQMRLQPSRRGGEEPGFEPRGHMRRPLRPG